ncbi:MAG: four helix bundle protein [Candidatus Kerfeldbacteria bacterium]|nr:four helix bundle protein [Candidatus Kerfeldbacteria bacterium]
MAKNFENLKVWQESVDLVSLIYRETKRFPQAEQFGLTSQIRRAVVSVPSNIAEGAGRSSRPEFIRFINISLGSLNEVESLIHVSVKLNFISEKTFQQLKDKINQLGISLGAFKRYLAHHS